MTDPIISPPVIPPGPGPVVPVPKPWELTPVEVRAYISDDSISNHLIDGVEFTDARINLAKKLALGTLNTTPPFSSYTEESLNHPTMLLQGVLWHLYQGQVALAARNQMSYSDGGLTIPIEERYQYYIQLAQQFEQDFKTTLKNFKIAKNLASGWGEVQTDYSTFPVW